MKESVGVAGARTRTAIQWILGPLTGVLLVAGCEELPAWLDDVAAAMEPESPSPAAPEADEQELENAKLEEPLPERPADSVARSETEVITFRSILESKDMSREERIRAFQKLDPAALQRRVAQPNVSGAPQTTRTRRPTAPSGPSDYEIQNARRRVPVVMYSTAWCGVCKRARAYFEKERISYVEHDVDQDLQARNEYLLLNPRRSVPTIKIGDEVIVGFSAAAVERALDTAARSRLN